MKTPAAVRALALLLGLATVSAHAAPVVIDNFSSVTTNGTLLTTVPGWSGGAGVNSAAVSSVFGYNGTNGARISSNGESYALTLGGESAVTAADGALEFKFNFRGISGGDNYQYAQIMIGQTGGVNGLVVEFNGGTNNTSTDNSVRVSTGVGASWSNTGVGGALPNSAWVSGNWYEVTLSFSLLETGVGRDVTGSLSVYDLSAGAYLFQNASIAGTGNTGGAFHTANIIQIKNNGSARAFDISEIRLGTTAVPEPAGVASLAGLLALGFTACRRRVVKK